MAVFSHPGAKGAGLSVNRSLIYSNPDLSVNSILRSAVKGLDSQILLDPFKEKLNLPAALI
jgi:hypothetical protein